jgi:RNA polymerase sigma-70 factor (ECF subfamily)
MTTQWTRVIEAGQRGDRAALSDLCQAYWQPIYGFIRARGFPPDRAEEFTQGVFAQILNPKGLASVRRDCGRFRNWLRKVAVRHASRVLNDERRPVGGVKPIPVSIDTAAAEEEFRLESRADLSADRVFDRCWARVVVNRAIARLRQEYVWGGRERQFSRLEALLTDEDDGSSDAELAQALGWTEVHVRVDRWQMKQKAHALCEGYLREEIGRTVATRSAIEDEIRVLWEALA